MWKKKKENKKLDQETEKLLNEYKEYMVKLIAYGTMIFFINHSIKTINETIEKEKINSEFKEFEKVFKNSNDIPDAFKNAFKD